jgi:hypothetical protein
VSSCRATNAKALKAISTVLGALTAPKVETPASAILRDMEAMTSRLTRDRGEAPGALFLDDRALAGMGIDPSAVSDNPRDPMHRMTDDEVRAWFGDVIEGDGAQRGISDDMGEEASSP